DLETVARSEHELARVGEPAQRTRRGRELRDRAGADVVTVGEATWNDRRVVPREVGVLVPEDVALDLGHERERVLEIALAPGAGIAEDRDARHAGTPLFRENSYCSMTGLASSSRPMRLTANPVIEQYEFSLNKGVPA